jgi:cell division transport system permease protein
MLLVTLMLVGNTMRLAAHSRQRETGIMRLVGASKWYIQLPFVLEAIIAAAIGGGLAVLALVGVKVALVDGFLEPNFRFTPFVDWNTVWTVALTVFAVGVLLAAIAAFVSLRRYLRV